MVDSSPYTHPPVDPDLFSFVTSTDSTMSDMGGPGRTLDRLISVAGTWVELRIGAVAQRFGFGPRPILLRLLDQLRGGFCSSCVELVSDKLDDITRDAGASVSLLIYRVADELLSWSVCKTCRGDGWREAVISYGPVVENCRALVEYLRQDDLHPSARALATECVTTLICLNSKFRTLFLDLGCLDTLESLSAYYKGWPDRERRITTFLTSAIVTLNMLRGGHLLMAIKYMEVVTTEDFRNEDFSRCLLIMVDATRDMHLRVLGAAHLSHIFGVEDRPYRKRLIDIVHKALTAEPVAQWWSLYIQDTVHRVVWKRLLGEVYWLCLDNEFGLHMIDPNWVQVRLGATANIQRLSLALPLFGKSPAQIMSRDVSTYGQRLAALGASSTEPLEYRFAKELSEIFDFIIQARLPESTRRSTSRTRASSVSSRSHQRRLRFASMASLPEGDETPPKHMKRNYGSQSPSRASSSTLGPTGDEPPPYQVFAEPFVLNLPTTASDNEIRERYRALSVVFHPDKQRDDQTRETAAKTFLDIQKAYEVLSEPFSREVYDALGEEGLSVPWPEEWRSHSRETLRNELRNQWSEIQQKKLEATVNARSRMTCGIDATSLFANRHRTGYGLPEGLADKMNGVRVSNLGLRHTFQRRINDKTRVTLGGHMSRQRASEGKRETGGGNFFGTIRHQYSPRLDFEATTVLIRERLLSLKGSYRSNHGTIQVQTPVTRHYFRTGIPPITVSLSRQLFPKSALEGVISLSSGPQPHFAINIVSPKPFDLTSSRTFDDDDSDAHSHTRLFYSPLAKGMTYWSYGATVAGLATGLRGEWGVTFAELAVQLKMGLELGFGGLSCLLTGTWSGEEDSEVSTSVGLGQNGVFFRLDLAYLGQRLSVPVTLSTDYDGRLALWTAVLPSTAFVLGYQFILKPMTRKKRIDSLRQVRKRLHEETSDLRRQYEDTVRSRCFGHFSLDAIFSLSLTGEVGTGLVILEATYSPTEQNEETADLNVDVTIPIQALIHGSQLYIPGHRAKSSIQGFYDPAPFFPKVLRIRYQFCGRSHYAEIPDQVSVVLPLEAHLVE
ncbi:hypothetical protein JAAARDRAFT_205188 [Jaapia argillacea MUCL 33604]|uniref:J domain-containing protein n=1 Tax=Jaapia argillacea MUCL 33604 TaxID=933084 RepID=A0A067PZD0_9AGAM|nr:hypothetical protein JAAARDRAFT_205188 [Jaapia argillacea MUCL 33604]